MARTKKEIKDYNERYKGAIGVKLTPEQQKEQEIRVKLAVEKNREVGKQQTKPFGAVEFQPPTEEEIKIAKERTAQMENIQEQIKQLNPIENVEEQQKAQETQPQGIIGKGLAKSPLGLLQEKTGLPLIDVQTGDAERLGRTAIATGAAFGGAALLGGGGAGGAGAATVGTSLRTGTLGSILKTNKLAAGFFGISILGFVRDTIQEAGMSASGAADMQTALADSANDLTDIQTQMDLGMSPQDALSQIGLVEDNVNTLDSSLRNMNLLYESFYTKTGYKQRKDAIKLRKSLLLMRFNIIQNQGLLG